MIHNVSSRVLSWLWRGVTGQHEGDRRVQLTVGQLCFSQGPAANRCPRAACGDTVVSGRTNYKGIGVTVSWWIQCHDRDSVTHARCNKHDNVQK